LGPVDFLGSKDTEISEKINGLAPTEESGIK